jgi:hypothetical protein
MRLSRAVRQQISNFHGRGFRHLQRGGVMFLVMFEGEAFSVSLEGWIEYLELVASGRQPDISEFGPGVGEIVMDATGLSAQDAAAAAAKARLSLGAALAA